MEFKHFSHSHGLVLHHPPQGSEVQCSGCKSPGSGPVYACWQCSYFLHEQCFRATRSFDHPSHPQHPLTLVSYPTYASAQFFCNSCSLAGSGFCYCCSECEFDVHVGCAHVAAPPHLSHPTSVPLPNSSSSHQPAAHQNHVYPPPVQNGPYPNYVS